MSSIPIPGLSYVANEDVDVKSLDLVLQTFTGEIIEFPEIFVAGNSRPLDQLQKHGYIYKGKFGIFYKCQDKINWETYTLKKIIFPRDLKEGIPVNFLQEISILNLLKHENIVNSHGTVVGKLLTKNFLLLDYCVFSLKNLIERKCDEIYESTMIKYMMNQMVKAIHFIHESDVVHRHISCNSILFTDNLTLKIGGFRNATFYSNDSMTPVESDVTYKAPELLLEAKSYGYEVDIWAIGCIFAKLLLRKPLFTGDSVSAVLKSMFNVLGTPNGNIWPGFEAFLKKGTLEEKEFPKKQPFTDLRTYCAGVPDISFQLLQDILIYYPTARLTASQILENIYLNGAPYTCPFDKIGSIRCAASPTPTPAMETLSLN